MIDRLNKLTTAYKTSLLLAMMGFNFLLTGVDVLMAHSQNNFFRWELIPLVFSPLAVLAILVRLIFRSNTVVKRVFQTVTVVVKIVVAFDQTFLPLTECISHAA
jgi:hypothetical protein